MNDLALYKDIFDGPVGKLAGIENVRFIILIGKGTELFFLPEMVNGEIVRNADHPWDKLAVIPVFPVLQGTNDLDERILENILGKLLVLDNEDYIGKNLVLVPVDQDFDTRLISLDKPSYQLLVWTML